jgi:enoyl-CoA hydratase/carnithine racemase
LRIGLVSEVWPLSELKARAISLAEELAAQPRLAVKSMLECLVGVESKSLDQSLAEERRATHLTKDSPDALEGMNAFLAKRKPQFNKS